MLLQILVKQGKKEVHIHKINEKENFVTMLNQKFTYTATILTITFFGSLFLMSCKETPETFAIHSPIYPAAREQVTFTLNRIDGNVKKVRLFNTINTINSSGNITSTVSETLLRTWDSPTFPINFTTSSGYGSNKLVEYRFEVMGDDKTYNHVIKFATNPYPVANSAVPVYAVGDVDRTMNVVFVPDQDMAGDLKLFYTHVGRNIDSSFHREEWVRRFRSSYNFYLNPFTGKAGDFDKDPSHTYPTNDSYLDFAQGRVILHSTDLRDFSDGRYVGTEYFNRGTILHETGHLLYGMADEYSGGAHSQNSNLPNNWSSLTAAKNAAPSYHGKTATDAKQIGSDSWWKICNNNCIMLKTGQNIFPYDEPCKSRILFQLLQRARGY